MQSKIGVAQPFCAANKNFTLFVKSVTFQLDVHDTFYPFLMLSYTISFSVDMDSGKSGKGATYSVNVVEDLGSCYTYA